MELSRRLESTDQSLTNTSFVNSSASNNYNKPTTTFTPNYTTTTTNTNTTPSQNFYNRFNLPTTLPNNISTFRPNNNSQINTANESNGVKNTAVQKPLDSEEETENSSEEETKKK